MARIRRNLQKAWAEWLKKKSGEKQLGEYKPFLTVRDVPSRGFVHRIRGWKTHRIHHLFSNMELGYFLLLEWDKSVLDIREQYPIPLHETQDIAERLGIRHPRKPGTQELVIMTTDFLVDRSTSQGRIRTAHAVKPSKELAGKRTLEKLEIERTYWVEKGIDWTIVTELEIPEAFSKNILLLHSFWFPERIPEHAKRYMKIVAQELLGSNSTNSFASLCLQLDERIGFDPGSSLTVAKHMISTQKWRVDLSRPLDFSKPLQIHQNRVAYA